MATYTTTQSARDEIQISFEDLGFQDETQYEDLIDDLILYAQRIIDNYCQVPPLFFTATGITITDEHHDSDGSGFFNLHYYPITAVTTLSRNSASLSEVPAWVPLIAGPGAGSDYIAYPDYRDHGKIYIYNRAPPTGYRNIKCTYKAGYATVPADVVQITNEIVANIVRSILKRKLTPQDITQMVIAGGDIRAVFSEGVKLSAPQKEMLNTYKVNQVTGRRG